MSDISYRLGQTINGMLLRAWTQVFVQGGKDLPSKGPAIVMTNHISHFDPLLIGSSLARPLDFMADKPLLDIPVVGSLLKSWNAFPIDRQRADRQAVKIALQRLQKGRVLGIFPEGGVRHGTASILVGHSLPKGTLSLWKKAKCPALVGALVGADQLYQWRTLFQRPRLFLHFAPLLPAPHHDEDLETLRCRVTQAIRAQFKIIHQTYQLHPYEAPHSAQERWGQKVRTFLNSNESDSP